MRVKLLHEDAKLPVKAYVGDAGFDCFNIKFCKVPAGETLQIKLGIAIEINRDEVAIVSERSCMAINNKITSIGNVIDSNYRGEISCIFTNLSGEDYYIEKGDKICQLIIMKISESRLEEVETLSESLRGNKAHFSSGK